MPGRRPRCLTAPCLCRVCEGSCRVGLLAVPPDSPLGRLKGSDNLVRRGKSLSYEKIL